MVQLLPAGLVTGPEAQAALATAASSAVAPQPDRMPGVRQQQKQAAGVVATPAAQQPANAHTPAQDAPARGEQPQERAPKPAPKPDPARLCWLSFHVDNTAFKAGDQMQSWIKALTPVDLLATLAERLLTLQDAHSNIPDTFEQTGSETTAGPDGERTVPALAVALKSSALVRLLLDSGPLLVQPEGVDDPAAGVPYVLTRTVGAPTMYHALADQKGFWVEVFIPRVSFPVDKAMIIAAFKEDCVGITPRRVTFPPGRPSSLRAGIPR